MPLPKNRSARMDACTLTANAQPHPASKILENPIMGKKLYVGNLSYDASSSDLEQMFSAHGTVESATIIADRDTGRSKGFGFVEMSSEDEAQAAIDALNGTNQGGRDIKVNEAKPMERRSGGGGGGYRGGRGGGGGGGGRDRW